MPLTSHHRFICKSPYLWYWQNRLLSGVIENELQFYAPVIHSQRLNCPNSFKQKYLNAVHPTSDQFRINLMKRDILEAFISISKKYNRYMTRHKFENNKQFLANLKSQTILPSSPQLVCFVSKIKPCIDCA